MRAFLCNDFLLGRRLILHKLNVRHLRSGRRRDQKEESQNEARDDKREVEYIRTACRFRQLDYIFRIYLLALNDSGSVICISCRICEIGKKESHDDHGSGGAEMPLRE